MSDVTFESLNEAFGNIDHSINVMASRVVAVALEKIEEILAPYPPQPDRMRSGHFNGYVRGIGTFPKSAFNADDKQPGGFSVKKNARKTIKASLSENARLKRLGDQQGRQDLANALTTKKVGQIRLTSQQMDKRFKTVVSAKGANVVGVLTNLADYSGFVLGPKEGDPHQTDFHNKTGWVSADDAVEQAWPMIDTEVDSAIDQFIAEFGVQ
jgi:hypothetical protein